MGVCRNHCASGRKRIDLLCKFRPFEWSEFKWQKIGNSCNGQICKMFLMRLLWFSSPFSMLWSCIWPYSRKSTLRNVMIMIWQPLPKQLTKLTRTYYDLINLLLRWEVDSNHIPENPLWWFWWPWYDNPYPNSWLSWLGLSMIQLIFVCHDSEINFNLENQFGDHDMTTLTGQLIKLIKHQNHSVNIWIWF